MSWDADLEDERMTSARTDVGLCEWVTDPTARNLLIRNINPLTDHDQRWRQERWQRTPDGMPVRVLDYRTRPNTLHDWGDWQTIQPPINLEEAS